MAEQRNANPLLLGWVKGWLDQAKERNTKGVHAYKKAYESLRKCPITFTHPSELSRLDNFGPKLCQRLTDKLKQYCEENGLPMPKKSRRQIQLPDDADEPDEPEPPKKKRKPTQYTPKHDSGPYGLILALGELPGDGRSGMTKEEVIAAAERHCSANYHTPLSANATYTAFNSMKTLLAKELVVERGRPVKRYALTDEGWDLAKSLQTAVVNRQVGNNNNDNVDSNSNHARATVSKRRVPSPNFKAIDKFNDIDSDDDFIEIDATEACQSLKQPPRQESPVRTTSKRPLSYIPDPEEDSEGGGFVGGSSTISKPMVKTTTTTTTMSANPIRISPGAFTVHLLLDSREVRAKTDRDYMQRELEKKGTTPITRALPLGDFLWVAKLNNPNLLGMNGDAGNEVVLDYILERKRLDDLVSSIKDGRFREQKFRLSQSGLKNVIYLVEKMSMDSDEWNKHAERVQTAMASTQVVNGYFVHETQTTDDTIRYIHKLTQMLKKKYESQPLYILPGGALTPQTYIPLLRSMREKEPSKGFYISYNSFNSLADKSDTLTLRDLYLKMLMCTRGVTAEKALEIQALWRTPREFVEAFDGLGDGEAGRKKKNNMVFDHMAHMVGKRKMTKALSEKVAAVWAT